MMFGTIIRLASTIPFLAMFSSCTWMASHPEETQELEEEFIDVADTLFIMRGVKDVPLDPRPSSRR